MMERDKGRTGETTTTGLVPTRAKKTNRSEQEDGSEQALPVSSASSFPLWVIDGELDGAGRKRVTQVPGANEELGWVNPRRWVRESVRHDSSCRSSALHRVGTTQ